jgi:hypothetical protein
MPIPIAREKMIVRNWRWWRIRMGEIMMRMGKRKKREENQTMTRNLKQMERRMIRIRERKQMPRNRMPKIRIKTLLRRKRRKRNMMIGVTEKIEVGADRVDGVDALAVIEVGV